MLKNMIQSLEDDEKAMEGIKNAKKGKQVKYHKSK